MIPEVEQSNETEAIREKIGRFLIMAKLGGVNSYRLFGTFEEEELKRTDYLAIFPTSWTKFNLVPLSDREIPLHKFNLLQRIYSLAVPLPIVRRERPDEHLFRTNIDIAIEKKLPIAVLVFFNLSDEKIMRGKESAELVTVDGLLPTIAMDCFRQFARVSLEELARWN